MKWWDRARLNWAKAHHGDLWDVPMAFEWRGPPRGGSRVFYGSDAERKAAHYRRPL